MKIKDNIYNDVGVLSLKGKLIGRPETDDLHDEIRAMLGSKINKIVLDLEHVPWINSVGVGAIMRGYATVKNAGGTFCLANISGKVSSILVITQLANFFKTYLNAKEAVADLKGK